MESTECVCWFEAGDGGRGRRVRGGPGVSFGSSGRVGSSEAWKAGRGL